MKTALRRAVGVLLTAVMICVPLAATVFAAENTDYTYSNPYAGVDWESVGSYKTQLHCQTNASDGYQTISEFCQDMYDCGYEVVALTDHGTNNLGWNKVPRTVPLMRYIKRERTQMADIVPLSDEEYQAYLDGTHATTNGTERRVGMLDVPYGIELNMATPFADCHLTGYFADYGQGLAGVFGDYETPTRGVAEAGGISMLAHVGEYVYIDKDSYNYVGMPVKDYYANKFARIFLDWPGSSIGMGVNSAQDDHTRCDRILYDQILMKTIPNGVVPWAFTFSDSHSSHSVNEAFTYTLMDSFDLDSFRDSITEGRFFSCSHYTFGKELNGMWERSEDYYWGTVEEQTRYSGGDWDDWSLECQDVPLIKSVRVDELRNVIAVTADNASEITFVGGGGDTGGLPGGQVLTRFKLEDGRAEIDLDDFDFDLFVRFYVSGPGGICYANPITVIETGREVEPVYVPKTFDVSTVLRAVVTMLDNLVFKWSPVVWAFKYYALGYVPFSQWKSLTP